MNFFDNVKKEAWVKMYMVYFVSLLTYNKILS